MLMASILVHAVLLDFEADDFLADVNSSKKN